MSSHAFLKSASVLAVCAAVAAPACAAETKDSTEVGEVVVTARKRAESLRDVPAAVTAFDTSQIRDLGGIANTQELLANVPAVNFANTSNPVTSEVSIRGSGTSRGTSAEAAVGLFRDGVFIGGGQIGGRTFARTDFFDIGRIEVLRGVQGALNGRNAVGGSINVVSARPTWTPTGFAQVDAARFDRYEGQLVVNQPLDDHWAIRLGANLMKQTKGFYHNPVRDEYFDRQESEIYRGQVAYRNGPFNANLMLEHGRDQLPGLMYQVYIRPGTSPIYPFGLVQDKYEIPWNSPSSAKQRVNLVELVLDYDLGFATITSTTAERERHSQNAYDRDASSPQFQAQAAAAGLVARGRAQGDPNLGGSGNDFARVLYQDLHVVGNKTDGLAWLGGFEFFDLNDSYRNALSVTPTAANPSTGTLGIIRSDFTSWALYGSLGYDVTEAFNVTAEARYTHDHKHLLSSRVDLRTGSPSGVGFAIDTGTNSSNFNYNVTAGYKVMEWLVYGKVGTAYRAGGFNLSQGDPRQPIPIPTSFDDEKARSFEVGAKGNLARRVYLAVSAYKTYLNDILVQSDNGCRIGNPACPVQATPFVYNAGKAEQWGVEAELTAVAEIAGGTARLSVAGSRQGGHITSGPDKGKIAPQRPKWTGTFTLNYRHSLVDDWTGFFNLQGNGRWGGVQEVAQTPQLYDYQILNVRAGVQKGPWEFAAYSNNVGNESYIVFEAPSTRRWNLRRTYGVEARYAW